MVPAQLRTSDSAALAASPDIMDIGHLSPLRRPVSLGSVMLVGRKALMLCLLHNVFMLMRLWRNVFMLMRLLHNV